MTITQQGFTIFKTGTLYKTWKRDNPGEAAKVDSVLNGGQPSILPLASWTGRGLMEFAQSLDGFPEMQMGTLYKKWAEDNPGELSKLNKYRAGETGPPSLATPTGQGFVLFVTAFKSPISDPLWLEDIVYVGNLSSWDGPRRTAAKEEGFSVVAILADPSVDPASTANLIELALIRNQLVNQGWKIVGWATTHHPDGPEASAQRAVASMNQHGLEGWIANGEAWWEGQYAGLGPRWLAEYDKLSNNPLALSCLSSQTPNYARVFTYGPWVNRRCSVQPQVYGNEHAGYTVYNAVQTMLKCGVPQSLLNLTFGVYNVGKPIPFADYNTWTGPRSIYLGERLEAADYRLLRR